MEETGVRTCERDPHSLVKALQPLVTLTGTVGEEEVGSGARQHVSVSCKHKHKQTGLFNNSRRLTQHKDLSPNYQLSLFCSSIPKKSPSKMFDREGFGELHKPLKTGQSATVSDSLWCQRFVLVQRQANCVQGQSAAVKKPLVLIFLFS